MFSPNLKRPFGTVISKHRMQNPQPQGRRNVKQGSCSLKLACPVLRVIRSEAMVMKVQAHESKTPRARFT